MQNPEFDISVIIVTYNNSGVIARCLTSLSHALESYTSQIVVIDNDSTDNTLSILKDADFWKPFSFTAVEQIYNNVNRGYTKGVNQGFRLSAGRFVLLLNPDVIFPTNPFEPLLSELENDDKVGIVAPQLRFLDGTIQPSCRRFPKKRDVVFEFLGLSKLFHKNPFFNGWRMPDFDHQVSRDVDQPQGAFLLTRHDVLAVVGYLDDSFPMFFSDVDWCYRIKKLGWRIRYIATVYVYHLRGASVKQKRAHMIISSHRSFVDYFSKHDTNWYDKCATRIIHLLLLTATPLRLLVNAKYL
ncbi:glycosyltransferase family 2 protein [candidate division KSB1 bacterium]|nr:glycosyltransferase family 2 protein [candidate division KSB1 bacterium]RQV99882.1 MAG: glycosyltransferase family 2 protein [candidate division KSB1 bacterium]